MNSFNLTLSEKHFICPSILNDSFAGYSNLKKQKQTKQTTRTGTEPQKWRSHGGLSIGEWEGERGGKVQRINSTNDRWKIDKGSVRIV